MPRRYVITRREPIEPEAKPEYADLNEAVTAFQAIRSADPEPERLALIQVDEDARSITTVELTVTDATA